MNSNILIRRSMPKLYLPLLRAQLIKLEKAFQPGLSTITWTSLEIPSYCDQIVKVLNEVDLFVKEVKQYCTLSVLSGLRRARSFGSLFHCIVLFYVKCSSNSKHVSSITNVRGPARFDILGIVWTTTLLPTTSTFCAYF